MHLGGAITDISRTSGIPSWKRGLLHMDNINFVDVIWFGTLALSCMLYHASNLLYPLLYLKIKKGRAFIRENPIEKKIILEAMPLLILGNYFITFVVMEFLLNAPASYCILDTIVIIVSFT